MLHESDLRDLAVDEEVEINLGESPDVQVVAEKEKTTIDPARSNCCRWYRGCRAALRTSRRGEVGDHQQRAPQGDPLRTAADVAEGGRVIRRRPSRGNQERAPIFRFNVPANGSVTVRYQMQATMTASDRAVTCMPQLRGSPSCVYSLLEVRRLIAEIKPRTV